MMSVMKEQCWLNQTMVEQPEGQGIVIVNYKDIWG